MLLGSVFWTSFILLLMTWVFYPLLMSVAARVRRQEHAGAGSTRADDPAVDVVIATREPPEIVRRRVTGLGATDPHVRFGRIIVAVDRRAPTLLEAYREALGADVEVVIGDGPGGKALALNAGVSAASAEYVVLLDSAQQNAPDSIAALVADMRRRPECGAISGAVRQSSGDRLMDRYWRYELQIRRGQDALHSIVSTSGQLTIVRRALWRPMPPELICDDLFLTMQLVLAGHRVGFCEAAASIDTREFTREQHFQRKTRTLTGLYQLIAFEPAVLLPWRNPIWAHFVLHKLMRFATPFLALIVVTGVILWAFRSYPHEAVMLSLAGAAALLLVAAMRPTAARRAVGQSVWALRVLCIPLVALSNGLRRDWSVWHAHQPANRVRMHG